MPRSVFGEAIWERRRSTVGWVFGGIALATLLASFYPTIRAQAAEFEELVRQLPPGLLAAMRIDPDLFTTARGYIQGQLFGFTGPLLVVVYAVLLGGGGTADEERRGTADVLFALPVSRGRVVVEKLAAAALLLAGLVATFTVALLIANPLADLRLPVAGILGMDLGLYLLGGFFGTLAALVGGWSGRRGLGAGVAGAVAMLVFVLNGLAPVVEWLSWTRPLNPFEWYLRNEPLANGPSPWHLVLLAGTLLLATVTVAVVRHRDLGTAPRIGFLPRVRRPRQRRAVSSASPLLRTVTGKTVWDRRSSLGWWIGGMAAFTSLLLAVYPSIADLGGEAFRQLLEAYPRALLALFGITDPEALLTGPGFVSSRIHGSIGLAAILVLAISSGAGTLAGEEARGTLDLVATTPVRRRRLVLGKSAGLALVLIAVVVGGVAVPLGAGAPLVDLGLDTEGLLAGNLGLLLIAFLHGALALAVGAATGRRGLAAGTAVAAALAAHLLNGFGSFVSALEPLRPWSPFYWYAGPSHPLARSLGWHHGALLAVAVVLVAAAVPLFERRDLGT